MVKTHQNKIQLFTQLGPATSIDTKDSHFLRVSSGLNCGSIAPVCREIVQEQCRHYCSYINPAVVYYAIVTIFTQLVPMFSLVMSVLAWKK